MFCYSLSTSKNSTNLGKKQLLVVWRLVDGKAGHEAQTEGLVQALRYLCDIECHDIRVPLRREMLGDWIRGRCRFGVGLPDPQILLGAGQQTHLGLMAARRARGGKAIVLMRPSLPLCWFDLCLIPAHDALSERDNVIMTQGVLNPIQQAKSASLSQGLIMIGGPSAHYHWDTETILGQIKTVAEESNEVQWTLTTSRRTPPETETALLDLEIPNLQVVPVGITASGWVREKLQNCGLVWVSEDSVSMIYEGLTSGARVGILKVPVKGKASRVTRGVQALIEAGQVISFTEPLPDLVEQHASDAFNEAERCAEIILEKSIT
ncbi:MAG: Uncharacterised protein [Opitutia bacterium UBA7350]|nr:MAG: Uncharacterised protein [Opitutae bacterium UBA7350]